jgi:lysophospholipase L1-like esterase
VVGDSYSDEYRFYPPDRATTRNWVELLAESRRLDFGSYSDESKGEPRNSGYTLNWARSDAESGDAISSGQHVGLARQFTEDRVQYAVVFIGGNDFIHALHSPSADERLAAVEAATIRNHRRIVRTLLESSPKARVLLVTVPDIFELPEFARSVSDGRIPHRRVTAYRTALGRFNAEIRAWAASDPRVGLADFDRFSLLSIRLDSRRTLLAGHVLDRAEAANDLRYLFLADERHLGPVGQALFAKLIVDALIAEFSAPIRPLGFGEAYRLAERNFRPAGTIAANVEGRSAIDGSLTRNSSPWTSLVPTTLRRAGSDSSLGAR